MPAMGPNTPRRLLWGAVAIGLLLTLFTAVVYIYEVPGPPRPLAKGGPQVALLRSVLYLLVLLTLIFCVSLLAFVRWSRHFRRFILRRPREQTVATDVWQMHRLPEEQDDDEESPPAEADQSDGSA